MSTIDPWALLVRVFEGWQMNNFMKCRVDREYPLNWTALINWKKKMNEMAEGTEYKEYIKNFAQVFVRNIQHITFSTFYDKCIQVGMEIGNTIEEFRRNNKVFSRAVLSISGNLDKSNFWCALIVYKALLGRDLITHIVCDISDGIEDIYLPNPTIPTQIFYIDDCAYSGRQPIESAKNPINKKYTNLEVYAAVCYISETAKEIFTQYGIKTLNTSVEFKSLRGYFQESKKNFPDEHLIPQLYDGVGKIDEYSYDLDRHLIYFDHKIADTKSVYTHVIMLGMYFNWQRNLENAKLESFITGCENNVQIEPKTNAILVTQKKECPPSFYKYIKFELITPEGTLVDLKHSYIDNWATFRI